VRSHRNIDVLIGRPDGAKQPPQPTGVIVDAHSADCRQGHRSGVALTDPDGGGAIPPPFVAQPKGVTAAALALASWEASSPAFPLTASGLLVRCQGSAEVDGGFREHLRGDLLSPCQTSGLLDGAAV